MLLAIDTATQTASLAIYDLATDQLLGEWTWQSRRRQTQDLFVAAQNMLAQSNITTSQLTALAVTTGPGSFTGVRIGVSAVKGIGMGLPTPPHVVGIPTLAVTAAPWLPLLPSTLFTHKNAAEQDGTFQESHALEPSQQGALICAYLQAGRGRYNWVFFDKNEPRWRPTVADHHAGNTAEFVNALTTIAPRQIYLAGESTADLQTAVRSLSHICPLDKVSSLRRAGLLALCASRHLTIDPPTAGNSNAGNSNTLAQLQPLYLQEP